MREEVGPGFRQSSGLAVRGAAGGVDTLGLPPSRPSPTSRRATSLPSGGEGGRHAFIPHPPCPRPSLQRRRLRGAPQDEGEGTPLIRAGAPQAGRPLGSPSFSRLPLSRPSGSGGPPSPRKGRGRASRTSLFTLPALARPFEAPPRGAPQDEKGTLRAVRAGAPLAGGRSLPSLRPPPLPALRQVGGPPPPSGGEGGRGGHVNGEKRPEGAGREPEGIAELPRHVALIGESRRLTAAASPAPAAISARARSSRRKTRKRCG